jgi:hypothetical protein
MARHIVTFDNLVAIARRVGVKVVAAPSSHRGRIGEMGTVAGVTCHWTGTGSSFRPSDDYPDYNVVKEGRAGLNNSLSAFGLGRHTAIYVFSEDLSYHAGTWSYGGTTDGNGHFLGIEAAGAGNWTPWQRRVYPRLVAAILLFIDAPASMAPTHAMGAMPRGRKSDFPIDAGWGPELPGGPRKFHDAVAWLMRNPAYINVNYQAGGTSPAQPAKPVEPKGWLMALSDKEQDELLEKTRELHAALITKKYRRMGTLPTDTAQEGSAVQMIRWIDGSVLLDRRLDEDQAKQLDELVTQDDAEQPPPPPAV